MTEAGSAGLLLGRDGRRAALGQLALVGRLHVAVAHRARRPHRRLGPHGRPRALGQRRPDGAVLLRRRPRGAARALRRRADRPSPPRGADARRGWPASLVPAALFLAINPSGDAASGWGVAIGTDTAFVLGVLALVGPSCPTQLRVFLLTLSIADDVLAVSVIGIFYSDSIDPVGRRWSRVLCLALAGLLGRFHAWRASVYVARARRALAGDPGVRPAPDDRRHGRGARGHRLPAAARRRGARRVALPRLPPVAAAQRRPLGAAGALACRLGQRAPAGGAPPVDELRRSCRCSRSPTPASTSAAACSATRSRSPITWGVVLGLVAGKLVGIGGASLGAVRLGLGVAAAGRRVGPGRGRRGALRHRLHRLAADRGPGLRAARGARGGHRRRAARGRHRRAARLGACSSSRRACAASAPPGCRWCSTARRSGARPHPLRVRRADDAGRVRRLRVPVLRQGHRRGARAVRAVRRRPALRLPPPAAAGRARPRRARGPGGRGGGGTGALLGVPRPAVPPPGRSWSGRTCWATRPTSTSTSSGSRASWPRASTPSACAATSRAPRPAARAGRRPSSSASAATSGPYDADTLARELEASRADHAVHACVVGPRRAGRHPLPPPARRRSRARCAESVGSGHRGCRWRGRHVTMPSAWSAAPCCSRSADPPRDSRMSFWEDDPGATGTAGRPARRRSRRSSAGRPGAARCRSPACRCATRWRCSAARGTSRTCTRRRRTGASVTHFALKLDRPRAAAARRHHGRPRRLARRPVRPRRLRAAEGARRGDARGRPAPPPTGRDGGPKPPTPLTLVRGVPRRRGRRHAALARRGQDGRRPGARGRGAQQAARAAGVGAGRRGRPPSGRAARVAAAGAAARWTRTTCARRRAGAQPRGLRRWSPTPRSCGTTRKHPLGAARPRRRDARPAARPRGSGRRSCACCTRRCPPACRCRTRSSRSCWRARPPGSRAPASTCSGRAAWPATSPRAPCCRSRSRRPACAASSAAGRCCASTGSSRSAARRWPQEELDRLAEAHRPIVRLRDQWVIVDPETRPQGACGPRPRAAGRSTRCRPRSPAPRTSAASASRSTSTRWLDELRRRIAEPDAGREPGRRSPPRWRATLRDYQLRGLRLARPHDVARARLLPRGRHGPRQDDHAHRASTCTGRRDPETAGPTLVVCPASLLGNWEREIHRFAPGRAGAPLPRPGARRCRGERRGLRADDLRHDAPGQPHAARRCRGACSWRDEAQMVKNSLSRTARELRRIPARRARGADGHARREQPLRPVGDPGLDDAGPARHARRRSARPGPSRSRRTATRRPRSAWPSSSGRSCCAAARPIPGIAPELPPKTETDQPVALTPEQAGLYEAVVREAMARDLRRRRHRAARARAQAADVAEADLQPPGSLPRRARRRAGRAAPASSSCSTASSTRSSPRAGRCSSSRSTW